MWSHKNMVVPHFAVRDGGTEMQIALLLVAQGPTKLLSASGDIGHQMDDLSGPSL